MKISRDVEPTGLIVTHFGSRHTYDDAIDALNELVEITRGSSEVYEIIIHEHDLEIDVSDKHITELRGKVKSTFNEYTKGALAFVASADYIFGLCRQLQMMIENECIAASVFRTEELARKWITEMQSMHCKKEE